MTDESTGVRLTHFVNAVADKVSASRLEDLRDSLDEEEWELAVIVLADELWTQRVELSDPQLKEFRTLVSVVGRDSQDFALFRNAGKAVE